MTTNIQEEPQYVDVNIEQLKSLFPSKNVLYSLLQTGSYSFILPNLKSSAITVNYLKAVSKREVFTIRKKDYQKAAPLKDKSLTVSDLCTELEKISGTKLGFEEDKIPNKEWVIDSIYSLDPNNRIFKTESIFITRAIPKEYNYKAL